MRTKEWLKKIREKNNLTQKELAEKIGISSFTIENIEQGKRLGSAETWEKIEDFFENDNLISISYDSEELIEELKQDILEFGEDYPCILVYKIVEDHIFFTNYDFIIEEDDVDVFDNNDDVRPFDPKKDLRPGEKYITTTFKYALEVLEAQNKTI